MFSIKVEITFCEFWNTFVWFRFYVLHLKWIISNPQNVYEEPCTRWVVHKGKAVSIEHWWCLVVVSTFWGLPTDSSTYRFWRDKHFKIDVWRVCICMYHYVHCLWLTNVFRKTEVVHSMGNGEWGIRWWLIFGELNRPFVCLMSVIIM